ncbi:MAG: PLP-dependent transferase [Gammaproteobacteria bacterium]|nr:PLP-dependent transferase [Gammaproteobacteria bacterium]
MDELVGESADGLAKQDADFEVAKRLSPRRKTSSAQNLSELAQEQLVHFSIDPDSEMGQTLASIAENIYKTQIDLTHLWEVTLRELTTLNRQDRIAYFNAKKFLCFQLAKLLDTLQHPFRATYQSLVNDQSARITKGPYPIFDNVAAIFSATPVITRTATYIYACTEWIDDAFQGKEMLLEVYSRLLNPTSISLANHIVDLECGALSNEYMAWNFNSGMAAIDTVLAHLLGHGDIVICSRNVYGGTFQLLEDWYGKKSNLDIGIEWFDGYESSEFVDVLTALQQKYADRITKGRRIYVYLESPCNPHGYVLDVAGICKAAHEQGLVVMLDSTVATPFLYQPLIRGDVDERPDYVIHSYTKDITGTGVTTAGVVIGRNETMFIPKNESVSLADDNGNEKNVSWKDTLFWNVYFIKGAFLDADKAFEVISGSRTLELRMLRKVINTKVMALFFDSHSNINVKCNALQQNENYNLGKSHMRLGLPAPLFTIDFEGSNLARNAFVRFFDCLEPVFGHMVSLGQSNTMVLCPALTSHSEMSKKKLELAGISPTTIRISIGDEDPRTLIAHFINAAKLAIDPVIDGFSKGFMTYENIDNLYRDTYLETHRLWIEDQSPLKDMV